MDDVWLRNTFLTKRTGIMNYAPTRAVSYLRLFLLLTECSYTQTVDDPLLSDNHFLLEVRLAELRGRAVFLALEYAVEVRQVVEAALVANLGYRHGGVYQQARRVAETYVDDVVRQLPARALLEEAAEGGRRHAHHVGQRVKVYFVLVVLADVLLYLLHAAAVGLEVNLGERRRGQFAGLVGEEGQLVEQREKLRNGVEALGLGQGVEQEVNLHYRLHGEAEAVARLVEHHLHAVELVGVDEAVEEMRRELDGYFPNVVRLAVALLPYMFEVGGGYQHKVVVAYGLHRVADDAPQARAVFYEVKLVFRMAVHGVGEFRLVTVNDVEAVFV